MNCLTYVLAIVLAACALPLSAQAPTGTAPVTEEAGGLPGSPLIDGSETLRAVKDAGGLTKLPLATAIAVIDSYRNALAQRAGSEAITDDLDVLKRELKADEIDGRLVGFTLRRLGQRTQSAADGDAVYQALARTLTEAGNQLLGR